MSARLIVEKLTDDAQAAAEDVLAETFRDGQQFANLSRTSVRGILVKAYTLGWVAGVALEEPAVGVETDTGGTP